MGNTQKVVIIKYRCLLPLFLLCILFLFPYHSKSQNLNFDNFSVDNGLSQNSVTHIVCDSFGLVWIATADGLNCYDGNKITVFHHNENDPNSIQNDYIYSLFVCEGQDIIIQGKEGIECFERKTGKFSMILGIPEMAQKGISGRLIGADYSNIWIFTGQSTIIEINKFNLEKKEFSSPIIKNSSIENINILNQPFKKGQLFYSDINQLFCLNTTNQKIQVVYKNSEPSNYIIDAKGSRIIILKNDSIIIKNNNGTIVSASKILGLPKLNNIKNLMVDLHDNIWIQSYTDGLHIISKNYLGNYYLKNYHLNISISRIAYGCIDMAGNIWIGTDGNGIYFLNHKKLLFENYSINQKSLMLKCFCPIAENKILVGTVSNGLFVFNTKENAIIQIDKLKNMDVFSFCKKSPTEVYMGTGKGIYIYDFKNHVVRPSGLPGADTISVAKHITINNNILYISHSTGLTLYDLKNNKLTSGFKSSSYYLCFEPDNKRYFLLTEYMGIWFFNGATLIQISPSALKDNFYSARHLYRENNSTYWFATEKGLLKFVFENEQRTKYTSFLYTIKDGLPNNFIYAVMPGINNNLWLSTNKGICEFDPNKKTSVSYDINDGLQSNEFNTGAYYSDQNGNTLFGGVTGLNFFNIHKLQKFKFNPNIFFNELSVSGKSYKYIDIPDIIEVPYTDNEIVAGFYCNDFSNPTQNKYFYQLEGQDKDWVKAQSLRQIRYAGLEPGKYILKIKTINADGLYSPEKKLTIVVRPPFWRTWWFITLSIIISLSIIIYVVQRLSNSSIKRKLKELERQREIEGIRQRISSDLHDDIGSGLSKMALISELAKSQKQNPLELQDKLSKLANNSRDMIRSLGEIVWAINPQNDKLPNLLAYMRDYASEYLETTDIVVTYHIQESQDAIPINPDFKRNIFLTLKESLHNAVKYSGASLIEIGFTLEKNHYTFWIKDNGKGIDPDTMRKFGQGLNSLKKRAENIGAIYKIESDIGKGVKISLRGTL